MKIYTCLFFLIFCATNLHAQNWINSAGSLYNDEAYDVEVDASGNVYATGYTTAQSNFGGNLSINTNGYSDIFVSKSSASGNFLWVKVFGGGQADRGYDIALDDSGNIYVTGYFQGTATFDGFTLTSNGTQDVFVVKLDNSGNVLWAVSEGGTSGDTGYGIEVDNSGNVIVTGQFKGTAQIGVNTFSSAINPNTNLPEFDIFISKYDANGNDLWSLQGSAKYDDRGLALSTDQNDNIYITGQFSDTLTIAGSTHNNTIYNAGMVLKLDSDGNEMWFRRMGAIQTLVYDLETDNQNNVYLTGDFQGQMMIIDGVTTSFLNGNYQYRIFVMKMNEDGEVVWMDEDDSDSEVSSKAICLDANNDIYLTGTFKCVFDEYADTLGSGLFNSVGFNDVFITKYSNSGDREWMRQYGGPYDDYCSGIAISQIDNPVISGGYTEFFNYPTSLSFQNFSGINQSYPAYSWLPNCIPGHAYSYLDAKGNKDIFIGKPVNLNLPHYYYYEHTICGDDREPCFFLDCRDTVEACGELGISFLTHTAGNGKYDSIINSNSENPHHGPYFDFLWNNGTVDNSQSVLYANNLGTYSINSERIDGCKAYQDTIEVIIHPLPSLPLLSDDHNININQFPYRDIDMCFPDTASMWFSGLDTTSQFIFTTPQGVYYDSLPHSFYTAGSYGVEVIDTNNCSASKGFDLGFDFAVTDTIVPFILFENIDSVCLGDVVDFIIGDSLTNPLGVYTPFCSAALIPQVNCAEYYFTPTTTGWQYITKTIILGYNNLCGLDTTHYTVSDSIYITVSPKPYVNYTVSGDPLLCPGDSVSVWVDTIIPGFSWTGGGIIGINGPGDTISVDQQSSYSYVGTLTDPITGCSKPFIRTFNVNFKSSSTIISNVPDNIICPGDSILLTSVETGIAYDWIGPQGNSLGNNQTIWVSIPGFYHCVLTDLDSCILTSNSIELKEYNTPYILPEPGTELCHTGAIDLTAIYSGAPGLMWLAPVNSTNAMITVTQPGVYKVQVSQCGFTVTDSITITLANITAVITPLTDTIICPGDTAVLSANSGMSIYQWYPTTNFSQITQTMQPGSFVVTVTDGLTGCTATSDTVHISFHPGGIPPSVFAENACVGDTISLYNQNQNVTTQWFANDTTNTPLLIGDSLFVFNVTADTTLYVENFDSNCTSVRVPVTIQMSPAAFPPLITGDTSICAMSNIGLTAQVGNSNLNFNWSGPNGASSSQNLLLIQASDTSFSGYYTVTISDNNCSSTDSIYVEVTTLPNVALLVDTLYKCLIDTVVITSTGNYTSILWNNGSVVDSMSTVLEGSYFATVVDSLGCSVNSDTALVVNHLLTQPLVTDTILCYGDSLLIPSLNNMVVSWYDTLNSVILINNEFQTPPLYEDEQYFSLFIDSNGCENASNLVNISVYPMNGAPIIYGDTTVCLGSPLNLSTDILNGATYNWVHNGTTISIGSSIPLPIAAYSDSGVYSLTVSGIACIYMQAEVNVSILDLPAQPSILGDVNYCSGDSLLLYSLSLQDTSNNLVWNSPNNFNFNADSLIIFPVSASDSGVYLLSVEDTNACFSIPDTLLINVNESPEYPYIIFANYCEGDTAFLVSSTMYSNVTYEWSLNGGLVSINDTLIIPNASSNSTGIYSLVIRDGNNCTNGGTGSLQVNSFPIVDLGEDTSICIDIATTFDLELDPNYTSYLWQDGSTDYLFEVQDSGWYYVTAGNNGCLTTDSIYFAPDSCLIIVTIPNVITPNGDGLNEDFILDFPYNKISIFNRWDQLVFETTDQTLFWNGTSQKGEPVSDGTYFYIIETEEETYKGFIQIIR